MQWLLSLRSSYCSNCRRRRGGQVMSPAPQRGCPPQKEHLMQWLLSLRSSYCSNCINSAFCTCTRFSAWS